MHRTGGRCLVEACILCTCCSRCLGNPLSVGIMSQAGGMRRRTRVQAPTEREPQGDLYPTNAQEVVSAEKAAQPAPNLWSRADVLLTIALLVATFFLRTYRIGKPGDVVFDEVHFGKYASYYLRREVRAPSGGRG